MAIGVDGSGASRTGWHALLIYGRRIAGQIGAYRRRLDQVLYKGLVMRCGMQNAKCKT